MKKLSTLFGVLLLTVTANASTQLATCLNQEGKNVVVTQENDLSIWVTVDHLDGSTAGSRVGEEDDVKASDSSELVVVHSEKVSSTPITGEGSFFRGTLTNILNINFSTGSGYLKMNSFKGLGNPGNEYGYSLTSCK